MNNFENVDLAYYGEDAFINNNIKYHEVQDKIKNYIQYIVNIMTINEFDKKSKNAKDFIDDLNDVVENISNVKKFDGNVNKITISDKYIVFDYLKEINNQMKSNKVIINKSSNDFYFVKTNELELSDINHFSINRSGIRKQVYHDSAPLFILNDESIDESLDELKHDNYDRRLVI